AGSFVDAAIILEQLGRNLVPEPYLASVVLGGQALALGGSREQQERWLAPMLDGRTSLALAWAEAAGRFEPGKVACTGRASGEGFVLDGHKRFVLNGHAADLLIVSASAPDGLGLFVVDAKAKGLARKTIGLIDGHRGAHVDLSGVAVGRECQLEA